MGASAQGQGSYSESSSKAFSQTYLSSLAETQEEILKNREALFQSYYMPEMQKTIESFDPDSPVGAAQMAVNAKQVNASFDAAQKQTRQALAQQNLLGSGVSTALAAQNNRARSSALADAYTNQMASSNEKKATVLASLGQLMPTPTSAAPTVSKSWSKGSSSSISGGGGGEMHLM